MKLVKYSLSSTDKIDLGTKVIYKYPTPVEEMDIALMVVKGRNPVDADAYILEHECQFFIYVTKGIGRVVTPNEIFEVEVGDVMFIPKETKFAMEGDFEYITVDNPAFYPEQSEEVKAP